MPLNLKTMNKQEKIQLHLSSPVNIGDKVKHGRNISSKVLKINKKGIFVTPQYGYKSDLFVLNGEFTKDTYKIGVNNFVEKPWNSKMEILNFSMESILYKIGYKRKERSSRMSFGGYFQELNFNPTMNNIVYQRELCWTLEQNQRLIDSIYANINIGMIILKKNKFKDVEKKANNKEVAYFYDVVDGKQRLNALLTFVNNEFPDSTGSYFKDFSDEAENKFLDFSAISYGELGENSTDLDVKSVFLGVNFTGIKMSQKHIDFVKNIKL